MRVLRLAIVASCVLNVVLAAVYLQRHAGIDYGTPALSSPAPDDTPPTAPPATANWQRLQGDSEADLVAHLRAEGFPREIIRIIVSERVTERYRDRMNEFRPLPRKFWEPFPQRQHFTPEQVRARRALHREMQAELTALLGEDAFPVSDAALTREFGHLPRSKIAAIKAINEDYNELAESLRAATKGVRLPEDEAKLAYLEREKQADLEALLTPEELLHYELRSSSTARSLRNQLSVFAPSEEEFIRLFHVQREVEQALAALGRKPTADEAREIRESRVQATLSPERFDEYQIRTAGAYGETQRFVEFHQLPPSATHDVVRTRIDSLKEARQIQSAPGLSSEQRSAQLAALAARARARLETIMGPNPTREYLQHTGLWLNQITAHPPNG